MDEAQNKLMGQVAAKLGTLGPRGTQLNPNNKNSLEIMTESFANASKERDELKEILELTRRDAEQYLSHAQLLEREISQMKIEAARQEDGLESMRKKLAALAAHERAQAKELSEKEVQIQQDRANLQADFAEREAALRREFESQQNSLREREMAANLQRQVLLEQTKHLEKEHLTLQSELKQRVTEHETAIAALVRQKEQYENEFQERLQSKASEYVDTALGSLKNSEERFERTGSRWAVGGLLGVLIGLVLAYLLTTEATDKIVSNKEISWSLILFFGVKGAVLLGLVVAMVRLCMRLARNYMHESLKTAERRHAINYEKFYLSLYGAGTEGEKLHDAFAHWNISSPSAFTEKDNPIPQLSVGEIGELAKALIGLKKTEKGEDKD